MDQRLKKGCPVPIKDFQHLLSRLSEELVIVLGGLHSMVQGVKSNPVIILEHFLTDLIIPFIVEIL